MTINIISCLCQNKRNMFDIIYVKSGLVAQNSVLVSSFHPVVDIFLKKKKEIHQVSFKAFKHEAAPLLLLSRSSNAHPEAPKPKKKKL